MHHAPAVSFPLVRSRFLGRLLALIWLAGAFATALWCQAQPHWQWRQALGLLCVVFAGALAARWWRDQALGTLHWDGERWQARFDGSAVTVSVSVSLDLQRRLLLRLSGSTLPLKRWLWLERDADPLVWRDLRRAVYCGASRQSLSDARARTPP